MTPESIHALKLRIWKLSPRQRTEVLSDLEAALALSAGTAQDAAISKISQLVQRAETLREKKVARKEKALQEAEDKLRQEIGF
jgi:hypothetical protein